MGLRKQQHLRLVFVVFALGSAVPSTGCLTDLGECDPQAAREIVFLDTLADVDSENGQPMYAGQALMAASCGNGQFCHSESVTGDRRYGVPRGLDFDFGLICTDGPCEPFADELDPIQAAQHDVIDHARLILNAIRHGNMPPGAVGRDIIRRAPEFRRVALVPGAIFSLRSQTFACDALPVGTCAPGETVHEVENPFLPRIGTSEGSEVIRNWMACGAPVIESTGEPGSIATGGDCSLAGELGHAGDCVVRIAADITPPMQTWSDIHAVVLRPRCGDSCHNPADTVNFGASNLDLSTAQGAYQQMVGATASGDQCGGRTLIVPSDSANSLLIQKLDRTQTCGDPMPTGTSTLDPAVVDVIRAWIDSGAPND